MVCKMVSMEERDKEEAQRNNEYYNIQYKGAGEGVVGLNQKTSEKRKNRYVMSTIDPEVAINIAQENLYN